MTTIGRDVTRAVSPEERERMRQIHDGIDRAMMAVQPMLPGGVAIEAVTVSRKRKGTVRIDFTASLSLDTEGRIINGPVKN